MMEAVTATLTARGVPKFDIISEAFQAAVEVPATLEPRTVHLTESDTSFTWTPAWGRCWMPPSATALRYRAAVVWASAKAVR